MAALVSSIFADMRRPRPVLRDDVARIFSLNSNILSLKSASLHELYAAGFEDGVAAAGLAAMLAQSLVSEDKPILWLRPMKTGLRLHRGRSFIPYGAGFAALGFDLGCFFFALLPDRNTLLQAATEAARCNGIGAVIMESWGKFPELGLTESRRLTLAARSSGVTIFSLRLAAEVVQSVAETRWQVKAVPSLSSGAKAPGPPAFMAECLKNRSGPIGNTVHLQWSKEHGLTPFEGAPLPRAVAALSVGGTLADERIRAA